MDPVDIQKIRPNINYHKFHDCVFVVVQRVICRIFFWLYTGRSSYVGDYLKATERGMKRINSKERATLEERKTPGVFDITLLYKVLQHTCDLADDRANVWHQPATSRERESLEHTLFILKEERNNLSHEPQNYMHMSESELETKLTELRRLCTIALQKAGEKCDRTSNLHIDIENMLKEMKEIETKPIPSGFTPEKLASVAAHEIRSKELILLPSCRTYVAPEVHLHRTPTNEVTSLSQVLSWRCYNGAVPGVICVYGDTGMGKTSLCQHVFDSWISSNGKISDLHECDLVIPIRCCDVATRDLVCQLNRLLEDTIACCGGSYEFLKLLKSLKILWLVDGYNEATAEAVGLLKFLCEERGPAHTILVTSRLQDSRILRDKIPAEEKVCDVILSGLTADGAHELTVALFQEDTEGSEDWVAAVHDFRSTLDRLGVEVIHELRNPLKLTLAVKLWKRGTLNIEKGGTLTQWYAAIQQLHANNLCSKIGSTSCMTKESISRKVGKWLRELYKVAFLMTLEGQYIHISRNFQRMLEDESDTLQLVSETCLSTFLVCRPRGAGPAAEDCSYSFIHQSQQFYLAAQHLYFLTLESPDGLDQIKTIIKTKNSRGRSTGQLVQFQPVLLYILSTAVAQNQNIQRPSADVTCLFERTVEVLVRLLSDYDCDWLEVVQHAAYSPLVVREVSEVIPDNWAVGNHRARAARALLEFKTPNHIILEIHLDTANVELDHLLAMVAMKRCDVSLLFRCVQVHDRVLDVLCEPNAVCNIIEFQGCLSVEGCSHLVKMKNVRLLYLMITTQAVLEKVMVEVRRLPILNELLLIMLMHDISPPEVDSLPSHIRLMIGLNTLDDIRKTVKVISKISCKWDSIVIPSIESDRAVKFVQKLKRSKVQVKNLVRNITIHMLNFKHDLFINYGPVPLIYPLHHFTVLWDDPPLTLSVKGDQLEVLFEPRRLFN